MVLGDPCTTSLRIDEEEFRKLANTFLVKWP